MRSLALAFAASAVLIGTLSLGLPRAAPLAPVPAPARAVVPATAPANSVQTAVVDFPNCPAPAVNGMNIRTAKTAEGSTLTIFVVVQNVGSRAFFAGEGMATLKVALGDRALGTFAVSKLAASEVKFFSVETTLPQGAEAGDVTATLDFAAGALTGKVAGTLDCQTSDNTAVRSSKSIRASLERAAG